LRCLRIRRRLTSVNGNFSFGATQRTSLSCFCSGREPRAVVLSGVVFGESAALVNCCITRALVWQRPVAAMERMVRMSACAPVLVPAAVACGSTSTLRTRHSVPFVGCAHRTRGGARGRVQRARCYREEGGGSGGASSAPDGHQEQSGQSLCYCAVRTL
jgi:hypothetical protein